MRVPVPARLSGRNPLAAVTGRLAWGVDGSCWSFTTVPAMPYNPAAPDDQILALGRLQAIAAGLPGEFAMWGLCQPVPPAEQGDIMRVASTSASWDEAVDETLAGLDPLEVQYRRVYYVAVKLPGVRYRGLLAWDSRAAVPPARVIGHADAQAAQLDKRLAQLEGRPSTPSEIGWIVERTVTRAATDLALVPQPEQLAGDALAELADCELKNGGKSEDAAPILGRWVRVTGHYGQGFQSVIAVENAPAQFEAPGSSAEWIARVERLCAFPVDWFVHGTIEPNHTAKKAVRFKARNIQGEAEDSEHDAAGVRPALRDAYEALKDQESELEQTGQNGLIFTTLFTVTSTAIDDLEERVASLQALFSGEDYQLVRRVGRQKELLLAQLPCAPYKRGCPTWRFRQYGMPAGFAGAAALCGSVGGDPSGMWFADDVGAGVRPALLWQPGYAASIQQSPSIVIGGELGSGKSYAAKKLVAEGLLPAGGQAIVIDATKSKRLPDGTMVGEWVHLASALDCSTQIIDVNDGLVSLDPFVMDIPRDTAQKMVTAALLTGCSFRHDSREADLLTHIVSEISKRPTGRTSDVLADLGALAGAYPDYKLICEQIGLRVEAVAGHMPALFGRRAGGVERPVYGPPAPPDLTAQFVVFACADVKLPSWDELKNPDLSERMTHDKRAGQALLTLITDIAAWRGKATRRPVLIVIDEAWRVTATPRGVEIVTELTTEGRRYDVGLLIIVQNLDRLPDDVLALAGQVLVFRARDTAATAAGRAVGIDPRFVELLRDIRNPDGSPASGFCYWRDCRGRLVLARVRPPRNQRLAEAFRTTPDQLDLAA